MFEYTYNDIKSFNQNGFVTELLESNVSIKARNYEYNKLADGTLTLYFSDWKLSDVDKSIIDELVNNNTEGL